MRNVFAGFLLSLSGCILSLKDYGQDSGVVFQQPSSWRQLCEEAKLTHKYIFVDCYATWCGPCKSMDQKVYPLDSVGKVLNRDFISVKVQMDTSKGDTGVVVAWYGDAAAIMRQFRVEAFPCFLFFSPDGNIVHERVGYERSGDFMRLAKEALSPNRQYFTLLQRYRDGNLAKEDYPYFVGVAADLKDTAVAAMATRWYMDHYLRYLPSDQFYVKPKLAFVANGLGNNWIKAGDAGFGFFFGHEKVVDSVMATPRYAATMVEFAILKAEVYPRLLNDRNESLTDHPDWEGMGRTIKEKYGSAYAEHGLLFLKERWFKWKKEWPEFVVTILEIMHKYPSEVVDFDKNSYAWYVFLYGTKKENLKEAVTWVQAVLKNDPAWAEATDTYANLLYKLGKTEEGLAMEQKAVSMAPKNAAIKDNLMKMQKGEPTWNVK